LILISNSRSVIDPNSGEVIEIISQRLSAEKRSQAASSSMSRIRAKDAKLISLEPFRQFD